MSKEFIFRIDGALCNKETGELCIHPEVQGELTRCKDCKHYKQDSQGIPYCHKNSGYGRKHDDYCSYAERKDGEADECYQQTGSD